MKKRSYFLTPLVYILFSLFFTPFLNAQDELKDSLIQVITKIEQKCPEPCPDDTNKINAYNILGQLIYMQQPDSAISLWKISVKTAEELINSASDSTSRFVRQANALLATALNNTGIIFTRMGEQEKALEYFIKALKIKEKTSTEKSIAVSLNSIGSAYDNLGNYDKALEYYNKALKIRKKIGDKEGIANSFNNIGVAHNNKGNIYQALNYYKKSIKTGEEIGDKRNIGLATHNIAFIYQRQGDLEKAKEYYSKSLKIFEELENKYSMAYLYSNLALIFMNQGDIPKSLDYNKKSLKLRQEVNDKSGIASSYNNIGYILDMQGNTEKALEYFQKSLKIQIETGDKPSLGSSYNNIGSIYELKGNYDEALEYYNKSLEVREEIGDKPGISITYVNIGVIYHNKADFVKAKEYYGKSLDLSKELKNKELMTWALNNIARVYQAEEDLANDKKYAEQSYKLSKELNYPQKINDAATLLRDISIKEINFNQADSFALEIIRNDNRSVFSNFATLSEAEQEKYFNTVVPDYMDFNSYALFRKSTNPGIAEYVYDNTIRNKGILLKSSTAMRNAILNSKDTTLIAIYYKWTDLRKQIAENYSQGKDNHEQEKLANEYEKELVKKSDIFSDYQKVKKISWRDIQAKLKPDEAAIEFINFKFKNFENKRFSTFLNYTDSIYYCALIIKPSSPYPEMIRLFEERQLEKIIKNFGGNNHNYITDIYGKNTETKTKLYNIIWKPIEEELKGIKTIYISPSGLLHKISFSAIAKKQNLFLCDNYNINILSGTSKLAGKDQTDKTSYASATIFGGINYNTDSISNPENKQVWNYLEGTKNETEQIVQILKKKKIKINYFSNDNATESELKNLAGNSDLIHIATHGFFYPDPNIKKTENKPLEHGDIVFRGGERGFGVGTFVESPNPFMRSGLVMAGANNVWNSENRGNDEDGVLTAQEVVHIDMRKTNLIVMSACETGLGDIKGSEGVYGLQRAFKMAGVKHLIMSLWQVPDKETKEFMVTFYKKLVDSKDIQHAFNETQKEMRKKYDPYFWAAFILIE